MKARPHAVTILDHTFLVMARTKAGAIRDVIASMRPYATADLATGEQLYDAGQKGETIIGHDRFKIAADPNQLPLAGLPETASEA